MIFADTSGLFALLVKNDFMHVRAKLNFAYFAQNRVQLMTSSFVLFETAALLQRRVGLEAVHDFHSKIMPLIEMVWVDGDWYTRAIQRLFALNKRGFAPTESTGVLTARTAPWRSVISPRCAGMSTRSR